MTSLLLVVLGLAVVILMCGYLILDHHYHCPGCTFEASWDRVRQHQHMAGHWDEEGL